ncbi:hypothetical protein M0812_28878 [Anaeramoeba flamelloides]|nr:hypothetical protein M0812_28878 [Anaeramoeba flamelloides]
MVYRVTSNGVLYKCHVNTTNLRRNYITHEGRPNHNSNRFSHPNSDHNSLSGMNNNYDQSDNNKKKSTTQNYHNKKLNYFCSQPWVKTKILRQALLQGEDPNRVSNTGNTALLLL